MKKRRLLPKFFLCLLLLVLGALLFWFVLLPDTARLAKENPKTTAFIEYRKSQRLKEGKPYRVDRRWKSISRISPSLIRAVLASEDDRFFSHEGLDWVEIRLSLEKDLKRGRMVRGASTLTQQLAKNLYLSPKKSLFRKAAEVPIALKMEKTLTKKRILELYLNSVEWGEGIFGAEAAARRHFGVSASSLSLEQAASLAAILPNPLKYSPRAQRGFVAFKRRRILSILRHRGLKPPPEREEPLTQEAPNEEPEVLSPTPDEASVPPETPATLP